MQPISESRAPTRLDPAAAWSAPSAQRPNRAPVSGIAPGAPSPRLLGNVQTPSSRPAPAAPRPAAQRARLDVPAPPSSSWEQRIRAQADAVHLAGTARRTLDDILGRLRRHAAPEPLYRRLSILLDTPDEVVSFDFDLDSARALYSARNYDPNLEERLAADPARRWERRSPGGGSETFRVDRQDPQNVVVQIQVNVAATAEERQKLRFLEDAIEKHLAVQGFTVDLVLLDAPAPGSFEVGVDRSRWTDARNWHGSYDVLAHELMHLFGLPDEYDLTDHYNNAKMKMDVRLYWFREQLVRGALPPDAKDGIMAITRKKPLPRHVRAVAGLP